MRLTYFLWFLYGKGVVYAVAVFVLHMESSCCIFRHSRCCWNCSVSQSISYVFDTVESLCFRLDKLCLFVKPAMSCHSHLVLARYQLFFFQRYSHLGSEQKLSLFLSACTGYIYLQVSMIQNRVSSLHFLIVFSLSLLLPTDLKLCDRTLLLERCD